MGYLEIAQKKLEEIRNKDDYYILAVETSCDETAVAITRGKDIISSVISSQIEIHKRFGGVVPEIASRNHILSIGNLVKEALEKADLEFKDISVIAVTYGAGLLGALLVGVAYAKALAYALKIPIVKINHIKGHVYANFISHKDLETPFICLLASGGHTEILEVYNYNEMNTLGKTLDDAAGEAFDKVARVLGLPYPGGPQIENCAKEGKNTVVLPRAFKGEKHFNFSYSGLKTAVINYVHNKEMKVEEINKADVACSFQTEAVGVLIDHTISAAKKYKHKTIAVAGGVAANTALREGIKNAGIKNKINVLLPPKNLCTDNAAMIGAAAYFAIKEGAPAENFSLDADANA